MTPATSASDVPAVQTVAVEKRFGSHVVLRGAALLVPPGAFYLLAGANGAGKSTLIKILLDLVRADRGSAHVLGLDSVREVARLHASVGYVPDSGRTPHARLTVERGLAFHARHYPDWDRAYATGLARELAVPLERMGRSLSQSESVRVSLVAALAHRPPVLLLDEPFAGLDPTTRDSVLALLSDHLAAVQTTVLVATQDLVTVAPLIDHVGMLREGTLAVQAPVDVIRERFKRYRVRLPGPWAPQRALLDAAIEHTEGGRESEWAVWGEEGWATAAFEAAGAEVAEVRPMSAAEAIATLLRAGKTLDVH